MFLQKDRRAVLCPTFSRDMGVFIFFALFFIIAGVSISLPAQGGGFLSIICNFIVKNTDIGYLAERTEFPLAFVLSYGISMFFGFAAGIVLCCTVGDYRYLNEKMDGVGIVRSVASLCFVVMALSWPFWLISGDGHANESYWRGRALLGVVSSSRLSLMIFSAALYLLYTALTFWVIANFLSLRRRIF